MEDPESDAILAVSEQGIMYVDGEGQIQRAEFLSELSDGTTQISITTETAPPVTAGPYFIQVFFDSAGKGILSTSVTAGVAARVWPRAFTFVAPEGDEPAAQTLEFRNLADRRLSYAINSDQGWLQVEPRQGTLEPDETEEFTVTISSVGVPVDVHQGNLTVVDVDGTFDKGPVVALGNDDFHIGTVVFGDGIDIPVTFALLPPGARD